MWHLSLSEPNHARSHLDRKRRRERERDANKEDLCESLSVAGTAINYEFFYVKNVLFVLHLIDFTYRCITSQTNFILIHNWKFSVHLSSKYLFSWKIHSDFSLFPLRENERNWTNSHRSWNIASVADAEITFRWCVNAGFHPHGEIFSLNESTVKIQGKKKAINLPASISSPLNIISSKYISVFAWERKKIYRNIFPLSLGFDLCMRVSYFFPFSLGNAHTRGENYFLPYPGENANGKNFICAHFSCGKNEAVCSHLSPRKKKATLHFWQR